MILHIDSDTIYLVAPKARSRVVWYFYLSYSPSIIKIPKLNGEGLLTILSYTTTPSLEAGDPVGNTLLTVATQLNNIEHVPDTQASDII